MFPARRSVRPARLLAGAAVAAVLAAPPVADAQDRNVSLRVLCLPKVLDGPPVELLAGDGTTREVELLSNRFAGPYEVHAAAAWKFGRTTTGADDKPVFQSWAEVAAPAAANQIVLLLRKGREPSDGFEALAFAAGERRFGARQFLVINMAREPVAGVFGGRRVALRPGQHHVVAPKPDVRENLCFVELRSERNGTLKPFYSTNWPLRDRVRGVVLVFTDPRTGKLAVHAVRDIL